MAHVVLFDRLAFQKHQTDELGRPTILPDGPEVIVTRGNRVPEWVPEWQLGALAQSGMVVAVADPPVYVPEPAPAVVIDAPPPPVFGTPPFVPSEDQVVADPDEDPIDIGLPPATPVVTPATPSGTVTPSLVEPASTDSRAAWEEYATSPAVGMSQEQVSGYRNKAELIAAVHNHGK